MALPRLIFGLWWGYNAVGLSTDRVTVVVGVRHVRKRVDRASALPANARPLPRRTAPLICHIPAYVDERVENSTAQSLALLVPAFAVVCAIGIMQSVVTDALMPPDTAGPIGGRETTSRETAGPFSRWSGLRPGVRDRMGSRQPSALQRLALSGAPVLREIDGPVIQVRSTGFEDSCGPCPRFQGRRVSLLVSKGRSRCRVAHQSLQNGSQRAASAVSDLGSRKPPAADRRGAAFRDRI